MRFDLNPHLTSQASCNGYIYLPAILDAANIVEISVILSVSLLHPQLWGHCLLGKVFTFVIIDSLFFVIADCCISLIFVPELLIKVNLNPVSAFCTIIVRVHADHCV